jgi:hypothetical protein
VLQILIHTFAGHPGVEPGMKTCPPIIAALFLLSIQCLSQSVPVPTPPMGWNSWDSYGTTVREDQVKANANAMARDLAKHGWQYIVVDIQW